MDKTARLGPGTCVWHLAQVREAVEVGMNTTIGRGAYIGSGVRVGNNCKIQNYAMIYEPAELDDGVFVGPGVVLTNDTYPRAVAPDGTIKSAADWTPVGVTIRGGASVGAHSVCVAPVTIGEWALVAAGSVVTKDVPGYALVAGAPARQIGWVGEAGQRLTQCDDGTLMCPVTAQRYREEDGTLCPIN